MDIFSPLVIVDQVYVADVACVKTEDQPPVAGYDHRPEALEITAQRTQSVTRYVHIPRLCRNVEPSQDALDLRDILGRDAPPVPLLVQPSQPPVTETKDHARDCNLLPLR